MTQLSLPTTRLGSVIFCDFREQVGPSARWTWVNLTCNLQSFSSGSAASDQLLVHRVHGCDGCSVLTELAKLKRPDRALATFVWVEQSPQYSIDDCRLYTRIVSLLGRHRGYATAALRILDRMQVRRIAPDLVCFNAAIDIAGPPPPPPPAAPGARVYAPVCVCVSL